MLRRVYKKCMLYGISFILLNLFIVIALSCEMFIPYVFSGFIDSLIQNDSSSLINESIIIMVMISVIMMISSYFKEIISTQITAKVNNRFINELDKKLERLPLGETKRHNPAYLNERIFNDIITIVDFSVDNFIVAMTKMISTVILFYLVASINIWMFCIVFVTLSINMLGIVLLNKLLYKRGYACRDSNSIYYSENNNRLSSIKETKIHSWYEISGNQFNHAFIDLLKTNVSFAKVLALLDNIGLLTKNLALILVMLLGGKLLINHQMTIGQLILITTYINMCLVNSQFFLKLGQSYQHAKLCFSRIEEFLNEEDEVNGSLILEAVESIQVKKLTFSYPDSTPLYANLNLEFRKGHIYCLKGKNGDGKSTLIDILLGINYGYEGTVCYNNHDILSLDMQWMRKHKISVVLQEPKVQRISVEDNITQGLVTVSPQSMTDLCDNFEIKSILASSDAQSLSGGEKQKVSVIRGLLKEADVLILDEPVSAMDAESIKILKNELTVKKKDNIIILISHNEELFDIVDGFVELSNEKVLISEKVN